MSLYNMIFGSNPASDVVLATLGLTRQEVGRFRDCFITQGKIAVYTRNGGGNRGCWHYDDPKYGNQLCKHHIIQEQKEETIYVPEDEADSYPNQYNVFMGSKRMVGTGKQIMKDYYVCENPDSIDCACPGCIITYRLPKHPSYLYDRDDDFDCTYATIYFSFPDEFAEGLKALDSGKEFDPDQRWHNMLNGMKEATKG